MNKFNFQIVLQYRDDEDNKVIFTGSTDLSLNQLLLDCLDELKSSTFYDVISVIYQPIKLNENGKETS